MVSDLKAPKEEIAPTSDPRRELIERIIASGTFSRSKRLADFLSFVCEQALIGNASSINEQKIGERVFGRSAPYDSANDGIVRVEASRLRQRLDRYFSEEGVQEPLRIVIPRGSYVPLFEPRCIAAPPEPYKSETSAPVSSTQGVSASTPARDVDSVTATRSRKAVSLWGIIASLTLAITLLAIWYFISFRRSAPPIDSTQNPIWNRLFTPGQQTIVVPGDTGLVAWENLMGHDVTLEEFVRGEYSQETPLDKTETQKIATLLGDQRYTSIVDLDIAQSLSHVAGSLRSNVQVRYTPDVRMSDLRAENVVLIGAPEANPWVTLYEPMMNFRFVIDKGSHKFFIDNRDPKGNEPKKWNSGKGRIYAIVALVPGLNSGHSALIIGGTGMSGTQCGWNFISDESQVSSFFKHVGYTGGAAPYFEAVIESEHIGANAARSRVVAWRRLFG